MVKILAIGSPVAYFVCEGSSIRDAWLVNHMVPNMLRGRVQTQVCVFLGRALLWKVFEAANGNVGYSVPPSITVWVMAAIRDL